MKNQFTLNIFVDKNFWVLSLDTSHIVGELYIVGLHATTVHYISLRISCAVVFGTLFVCVLYFYPHRHFMFIMYRFSCLFHKIYSIQKNEKKNVHRNVGCITHDRLIDLTLHVHKLQREHRILKPSSPFKIDMTVMTHYPFHKFSTTEHIYRSL